MSNTSPSFGNAVQRAWRDILDSGDMIRLDPSARVRQQRRTVLSTLCALPDTIAFQLWRLSYTSSLYRASRTALLLALMSFTDAGSDT